MKKKFLFSMMLALTAFSVAAQTYNEDDKESLRMFLRQLSAEAGKINAEQAGLQLSDTLNWQTDEAWVDKLKGISWDGTEIPQRLNLISWSESKLAGTLDVSKCVKIYGLGCSSNQISELNLPVSTDLQWISCEENKLSKLDLSANTMLSELHCWDNQLTILDLSSNPQMHEVYCENNQLNSINFSGCSVLEEVGCSDNRLSSLDFISNPDLEFVSCSNNQISALDFSANPKLEGLVCFDNHLSLSDLFAASELLKSNGSEMEYTNLGTQTLPAQTVDLGGTLNYPTPQNVFNGIYTQFTVTKNGAPASASDYTVTNGKITFNNSGDYTVTMTNEAIISSPDYPARAIVEVSVGQGGASIENIRNTSFYACSINNTLKIESPNRELITIYSATGSSLYSIMKDSGSIEIPLKAMPGSVIIVKGSVSGSVKVSF